MKPIEELESRELDAAVAEAIGWRSVFRFSPSTDPTANEQVVEWLTQNNPEGWRIVMEWEAGKWTVGYEGVEGMFDEVSHSSRLVCLCRFALVTARMQHCTQCGWSGTSYHACPGYPGENQW